MTPDAFNRRQNTSKEDYDRFVAWLFGATLSEARDDRGDLGATREVWLRFFRRGLQADLLLDELMNLLPELFLRVQYPDGEKEQVLEMIKAINLQELRAAAARPAPVTAGAAPRKNCSYCGRENDAAAPYCSECGKSLETPQAEDRRQLEDPRFSLMTVRTFKNVVDAGVVKARLEAAGIEACIPEEYTTQLFLNVIPCPLQSVTVRVAAKNYPAAMELLAHVAETSLTTPMPGTVELTEAPAPPAHSRVATTPEPGKLCVACSAGIPADARICPQCGWTQPA